MSNMVHSILKVKEIQPKIQGVARYLLKSKDDSIQALESQRSTIELSAQEWSTKHLTSSFRPISLTCIMEFGQN